MQPDYDIKAEVKARADAAVKKLEQIQDWVSDSDQHPKNHRTENRNLWTRAIDKLLAFNRKYLPPLHWLGSMAIAMLLSFYMKLVTLTARIAEMDERRLIDLPLPCVVALWHRDAPSLLAAFMRCRAPLRAVILIAPDPRGDTLARLCRWCGFEIVRGGGTDGHWNVLVDLAQKLAEGACVFITADGGGPARVAKIGAIALACAAGVPLIPARFDCQPALEEPHKWDAARNPLPFSRVTISFGHKRELPAADSDSIERARLWLEHALNGLAGGSVS